MPQDRSARRMIGGRRDRGDEMPPTCALWRGWPLLSRAVTLGRARRRRRRQNKTFTDKFMDALGLQNPTIPNTKSITASARRWSCRRPATCRRRRARPPAGPELAERSGLTARAKVNSSDKPTPRDCDSVIHERARFAPAELSVGGPVARARHDRSERRPRSSANTRAELFNLDWLKKEEYGTFTGEPPRVSLTDPPAGYQTPSPDQPYGIVPENAVPKPSPSSAAHGTTAIGWS